MTKILTVMRLDESEPRPDILPNSSLIGAVQPTFVARRQLPLLEKSLNGEVNFGY